MAGEWQRRKGIMLCYPFEESRLAKWKPPYIVQPKYDGERCRAVPIEGGYLLLSSEENPFFSIPHINNAINKFRSTGFEFDGELYCHGMPFERIHSIVSRTKGLHPDYRRISYHLFDIISNDIQMVRLGNLMMLHNGVEYLEWAPYGIADNLEAVMHFHDKYIKQGYEGIIVRHAEAPYLRRRSIYVMKFKPGREDVYTIKGVQEEIDKSGNPKGRLGALICAGSDGTLFGVGTGFSADDRRILWDEAQSGLLVGKQVRVKYQHLTSGKAVPRFPVFKEIIR